MSLPSWLNVCRIDFQSQRLSHRQRCRVQRRRLFVEGLEERRMLALVPAVDYSVGLAPQAIVSADFNNDGHLDLATANTGDNSVSLLLGDGQGGFAAESRLPVGATPLSVAVGDFDSDGNLDLATASPYDVRVMPGDGAGSFGAPASMGVYGSPNSVAVGDFNGDGKLDLGVTSNVYYSYYYYGYYRSYYQGYANVLLGNGDGTFSAANSTYVGYDYHNTALAADLNGDLYDDFVTLNYYYGSSVLLGDSSGYLQGPTSSLYTGDNSYAVAAGDLDADGDNDLLTANLYGNSVGVFLGDGAGGFSAPANYGTGSSPVSLVLGDFTGDGNIDVATANYYSNQVAVLHGSGDGAFSTPVLFTVSSSPWSNTAGDFNGDTWLDVATANPDVSNLSVLLNDQFWPPAPPTLRIDDVNVTEGHAGAVAAEFTVTLSAPSEEPVTVHYDTADGTATAGSDYQSASGTLVIPVGQTTGTITVLINGDRLGEPNETFSVNLSSSTNASITDGQAAVTIVDDEPLVTITDATVTEGDAGTVAAVFTVTRSGGDLTGTSTVNYSTANGGALAGSDYFAAAGTATFAPGDATKTITILVNGDLTDEWDQGFYVNLSAASGAVITDGQAFGYIVDNDPPPTITITPIVSANEGNNNGAGTVPFNFIVTLSAASEKEVRVNFATANGTATTANNDYIARSGTLVFAPGTTSKTISVQVRGDKKKEANERFYVNLSGATNATIAAAQGIGEIRDDDTPGNR